MGLLDQVLGQVIGNMTGGGQGRAGPATGGGLSDILGQVLRGGQGGTAPPSPSPAPAPRQAPGSGGLGDLLGGAGGKVSPLLLAVLAVLAAKHLPTGAGGLGSILRDMLGGHGRDAGQREEEPPEDHAGEDGYGEPPDGMDASPYRETQGGGRARRGSGGFLDEVGSMLDGPGGRGAPSAADDPMGEDFDDLRHRFGRNGQGDLMESWIGSGDNRDAAPGDLERALGPETIDRLSHRFGIDRGQFLDELSRALPQVVDGLTPQGRAPTQEERDRWM